MKHIGAFCGMIVALYACGGQNGAPHVRDLDDVDKSISTSSFVSQVDFLPLLERDSFLLGEIGGIRKYGDFWYVLDNKQREAVVAFDSSGHPMHLYDRRGHAEGEYADIAGFDVSPRTGDVCLLCGPPKIIVLDKELKFKREISLPDFYWRIAWYGDGFLLYSAEHAAVDYLDLAKGGKVRKIFQAGSDKYNVAGTEPVFMRDGDRLYFHTEQSDALYEIRDFDFVPVLSLDYALKEETNRVLQTRFYGDLSLQERMKYARPSVNCVMTKDSCVSFIYSRMLYYINMPYNHRYVNSVLKIDCGKSTVKVGNQLVSWKYMYGYDPEMYAQNHLYDGVKVNHFVLTDSLKKSGNPMLVLYTLKENFGE